MLKEMKASAEAYSDIAFIKYWGKKDAVLRLPNNGSLSMTLKALKTTTTVEFSKRFREDDITIAGEKNEKEIRRTIKHLNRIREKALYEGLIEAPIFAKVVSKNSFPKSTGLSSSGSGFAALTMAATKAIGLDLSEKELSILSRQGSGSSCRSICAGYVEWKDAETSEDSYAETIFPADYLDIRDLVVVISEDKKETSSTSGHKLAKTSPFFETRLKNIAKKLAKAKQCLKEQDFSELGKIIEAEALEFHSILLTSSPHLILWQPGTIEVMKAVEKLRSKGIEAYFSINTGFNIHVLTLPGHEKKVYEELSKLDTVKKIIKSRVAPGPKFLDEHLF